jgi:hypothetical protein
VQAVLEYTTNCETYMKGYAPIRDLIFECDRHQSCLDGGNSCEVLNTTLEGLLQESWLTSNNSLIKGYLFKITIQNKTLLNLKKENHTSESKGAIQSLSKRGKKAEIIFEAYY